MRKQALALACGLVLFTGQASALTLSQAWQAAKENEPEYLKSQLNEQISQANVVQTKSALLPGLSANAGAKWNDKNSDEIRSSYGIQLNQTIWDSSRWRELDASEARLISANLQTLAKKNTLAEQVITAYLDVASAQAALKLAEQKYTESEKLYSHTELRYKAGKIMATELEDTRANHVDAKAAILTAQSRLMDSQSVLANLINAMPDQVDEVKADQFVSPPLRYQGEQAWLKKAKDNSPNLLVALQNLKAAQIDKSVAKAGYYPTLSGRVSFNDDIKYNNNDLSAGVTLSIPLDLNGSTGAKVDKAALRVQQAQQDVRAVEIKLTQDVQVRYRKLAIDWQRVEMAQQQVESRQKVLFSKKSVYQAGMTDALEVIRAHNRLFESKNSLQSLLYQYWKNRVALLKAVGQLDDNAIAMVSQALES
ncbi:hypothetical protein A3K86_22240 [Photobacterium jeanii]|uniref:TolC family protein n=1 Tax=Photobacterium jeanii TaxID=858640 RepID=A0A178K2U0_9GAMM|nr:TolC family protein [Photobacterium jeanii]OAN11638.1 hypothetical protein A3K86_22240 [Photobacterium jeanii]PST91160.1 TolC family protein [Photobacterium jeanii]